MIWLTWIESAERCAETKALGVEMDWESLLTVSEDTNNPSAALAENGRVALDNSLSLEQRQLDSEKHKLERYQILTL